MSPHYLAIYGIAAFFMSILSGIAGAGGGFVMTPLGIFLGLAPAQAVSSGKLSGVFITIGSLFGLRHYHGAVSKWRIAVIMLGALVIGLIVPFIIKAFDGRWYRLALGIVLILMLPIMYHWRLGQAHHQTTQAQKFLGGVLISISLLLEGIFSGGAGSLVNVVLMGLFGQTTIEAQVTKRFSQLMLNIAIMLGLLGSGLIVWQVAIVGAVMSFIGSIIGGELAVKEGDAFASHVLMALAGVSAIVLIGGAL